MDLRVMTLFFLGHDTRHQAQAIYDKISGRGIRHYPTKFEQFVMSQQSEDPPSGHEIPLRDPGSHQAPNLLEPSTVVLGGQAVPHSSLPTVSS